MITQFFTPRTKLDKAALASVAAMVAMNLFVLAQQLQPSPAPIAFGAAAEGAVAAQQA
ncbi:MAG: hypothetical protein ACREBO_13755 [Novosphingobium sp.]